MTKTNVSAYSATQTTGATQSRVPKKLVLGIQKSIQSVATLPDANALMDGPGRTAEFARMTMPVSLHTEQEVNAFTRNSVPMPLCTSRAAWTHHTDCYWARTSPHIAMLTQSDANWRLSTPTTTRRLRSTSSRRSSSACWTIALTPSTRMDRTITPVQTQSVDADIAQPR